MRMTGNAKGFKIDIEDPVQRIQHSIDLYQNDDTWNGFDAVLMRNIRVISAEREPSSDSTQQRRGWIARAVFEVKVVRELCNAMENMHGGAVALVADMATTMAAAPASSKGFWEFGGVSRTLGVTYLSPMPMGSTVEVDCKLVSVGKRLSLLKCEFRDRDSRAILAVAEHGKVAFGVQRKAADEGKKGKL